MDATTKTCAGAVASVKRLRELARSTGYPPTAELARLVQAVESAADAVRAHATETISVESARDQSGLF